jgi:hypothetical protein
MINKLHKRRISVSEWIAVPDNPIQRDTAKHAKYSVSRHLATSSLTQANVAAAILPNGSKFKIDGHTRAYLWSRGDLCLPEDGMLLYMDLYAVDTIEDVEELYKTYDVHSASETRRDQLDGATRKADLKFNSGLLKHGGLISAVNILTTGKVKKGADLYKEVSAWKTELILVDDQMFQKGSHNIISSGCLATMLATCRVDGFDCFDFWWAYYKGLGTKTAEGMDGAQLLEFFMMENRGRSGGSYMANLAEISLYCYLMHKHGSRTKIKRYLFANLQEYVKSKGKHTLNRKTNNRIFFGKIKSDAYCRNGK